MKIKKFLDEEGLIYLWKKLSLQDYPNNETLVAVINAIEENKADKTTTEALQQAIDILNGTDKGSVQDTVINAIATIVANAPEDFDTLKEIADWIANDETGTLDLISRVEKAEADIEDLKPLDVQTDWNQTDETAMDFIKNKPTALPNPNTLTFTGATSGTYDGSIATTIDIPTIAGEPGYTPVRGMDYWTESDKNEIVTDVTKKFPIVANEPDETIYVLESSDIDATLSLAGKAADAAAVGEALIKKIQLAPEFANSIEECTDQSKLYVLPDGYIYGYIKTVTEDETVPNFTNLMDDPNSYIERGKRYSHSSQAFRDQTTDDSIVVPVPAGKVEIRVRGAGNNATYNNYLYFGETNTTFTVANDYTRTVEENGDIYLTSSYNVPSSGWYCVFSVEAGVDAENLIVTVNEEITYTTTPGGTSYQWASTGHAFVPADYEDRIIAVEDKATSNATRITVLENKPDASSEIMMYISPDGDDTNNGLSASAPKRTVAACVEAGATRISAKRGVYSEAIDLRNIGSLEIFPMDNNKTYVVGETRHPIVFDTSDSIEVSALTTYNSIKRVAYTAAANTAYDQVFVKQTLAPVVSASQSSYRAALWLFSDDEKTVCRKPKPVLTVAECEASANTFCYSGGYIYINADLSGVTKIIIPTITATGFYVNGAERLVLNEVEVRFPGEYTFDLWNCAWVDLYKCASKYTTRASGFHPCNTNGIFRACYATKCFDGFAPNYHGHTTYIDCVSEYNYDDGMSHHAGTEGTVIGGRYEGNGKAGNIPAYGAKVNIYGGLYKDNAQWGICYAGDGAGNFACGMVQGAVMADNPVGLAVQTECVATAMSCVYHGNAKDKDVTGTLTEY